MARFPTAPPEPENAPAGGVRSVSRALQLLQLMARTERSSWSLDEMSRLSGLAKSTVHRLLETMIAGGFVEHAVAPGYYRLGLQAAVVGSASVRLRRPEQKVQQTLDAVRARTDEYVGLAVLSADHAVTVARSVSQRPWRREIDVGGIFPAHACAGGKVLLAGLPEVELEHRFRGRDKLARYTHTTITCVGDLLSQLTLIRSHGYALDDEEYRVGLRCIGVPVPSAAGAPMHCLGVSVPAERAEPGRLLLMLPLLRAAAGDLSMALALEAMR